MTVNIGHFDAKETKTARVLGPWEGEYAPGYRLRVFKEGDPKREVTRRELDLGSVTSINTSKNINEVVGHFTITLKDGRALYTLQPMDVVLIALKGHNHPLAPVLHGVVGTVAPAGSASTEGGEESVTITGYCMGRYLQINMFFLPVWNPTSQLPSLLTYGIGGVYHHAQTPREIFRDVYRKYVVGVGNEPGIAGTPAAQHWLDPRSRFQQVTTADGKKFRVPYVQFAEESTETGLTRLEILGFTEGWVDEVGRVVYRRPAWDQPAAWVLPAGELGDWSFPTSDEGLATYVEVVPTGNPGLSQPVAEAQLAGRAPVPSSYVTALRNAGNQSGEAQDFSPAYIIDTYTKAGKGHKAGEVTAKGERSFYYRMMRKWGMRPMQISSPLLVTARQAQEQAEGLLRFFGRKMKTGVVTIPGEPGIRLGTNIVVRGNLRGQRMERAFYVEGVEHDYVEEPDGGGYKTTLTLGHGRDPHDAHFPPLRLENPSAGTLRQLATPSETPSGETTTEGQPYAPGASIATVIGGAGRAMVPGEAPEAVGKMIEAGNRIVGKEYSEAKHGLPLDEVQSGYDCSSATDFILYNGGFYTPFAGEPNPVSGTLAAMYEEGTGKWVTVYANAQHAFIVVAGAMFNTWNPETGEAKLAWYPAPASSIAAVEKSVGAMIKRHPKGY